MAQCPICGKETNDAKSIKVNDKKLECLCSTCQSYLVCLTKPVSQFSRTNAQIWATEALSKNIHPYVRDVITSCYNYSFSDKNPTKDEIAKIEKIAEPKPEASDESEYITIKTANTSVVKVMVFLSYAMLMIIGGIAGFLVFEAIGLFVGAVIGFLISLVANSVIMMFVEISENTATNAEATLRNEEFLREIRDSLKNSQK